MASMFVKFIKSTNEYKPIGKPSSNVFQSEGITVRLDTIATELLSPWGFSQLPDGNFLITDRTGQLYRVDQSRNKTLIKGTPQVLAEGQGGLLDLKLHPQYEQNGWIYLSYSKFKKMDSVTLTTTAIVRGKIKGDEFTELQEIFEANPYTKTKHHFGSKIMFDDKGFLYFSVGERGREKEFPQSTTNDNGKIHRLYDDGRIPNDNPFANDGKSKASIWSFGHRNPQGLIFDKATGTIWETEHGPRGGDELNIIKKGANYGWPVICQCINYDGKPITNLSKKDGMEQAETYWIPSIAPCGMTMITGDKYPAWEGNIMVGSLRFMYLERCVVKDRKVVKQEKLFSGIGRMRNAEMGRDGYLYIAVEKPGMVFKVVPLK
jgi:glucose/arabinose dehydrogenase